jgi:hypothetical protein
MASTCIANLEPVQAVLCHLAKVMLQRLGCTYAILRSLQQHFADEALGCWTNLLQLLSTAARVLAT